MIAKEKNSSPPADKFGLAGYQAEMQMAFYLRRAFSESPDVLVFNDLRVVRNGEVAQIDHLVLHRLGFVIVESKSVTGTIEVNQHLEFVRAYGSKRNGMKSPIVQARMQAQLLKDLLNDSRESLRRKVFFGIVQGEFGEPRFRTLVAISDQGVIKRTRCDPPELVKADQVVSRIQELIPPRSQASGVGGLVKFLLADRAKNNQPRKEEPPLYTDTELRAITEFLLSQHTPSPSDSPARNTACEEPLEIQVLERVDDPPVIPSSTSPTKPIPLTSRDTSDCSCRHCSSNRMVVAYGQYGYYFKCRDCDGNTPIDFKCQACGQKAQISKSGRDFTKRCRHCEREESFYQNPEA